MKRNRYLWLALTGAANILLLVLLDVFLFSPVSGPVSEASLAAARRELEGCRVLDAVQPAVSQVLLVESREGDVGLVVLEKSPFADRYRVSRDGFRALQTRGDEIHTAVGTMHDRFPVDILNYERLSVREDYEIQRDFRWGDFFRCYGGAYLLLWAVEILAWIFLRNVLFRPGG